MTGLGILNRVVLGQTLFRRLLGGEGLVARLFSVLGQTISSFLCERSESRQRLFGRGASAGEAGSLGRVKGGAERVLERAQHAV